MTEKKKCSITYQIGDRKIRFSITLIEGLIDLANRKTGSVLETCKQLGISRNVLNRWKNGIKPQRKNLIALLELADIPAEWLVT